MYQIRVDIRACLFIWLMLISRAGMAEEFPEQSLVDELLEGERPVGVVFLVMEYDPEALQWVVPRMAHYARQLRAQWPDTALVVISHGDEMFALQRQFEQLYTDIHQGVERLVEEYDVLFQVCGSYAYQADIDVSSFPDYVAVVPFAPAEIENYRLLEYRMIDLELTW